MKDFQEKIILEFLSFKTKVTGGRGERETVFQKNLLYARSKFETFKGPLGPSFTFWRLS